MYVFHSSKMMPSTELSSREGINYFLPDYIFYSEEYKAQNL